MLLLFEASVCPVIGHAGAFCISGRRGREAVVQGAEAPLPIVLYALTSGGGSAQEAPSGYSGVQYTQGNWFILNTMGGQYPDPKDKWDQFRAFNAKAIKSSVLGFTPDLSRMPIQIQNVRMVWEKYYPSLMTGSVDVDTELPKFNQELKQAGLGELRAEVQKQLDAWRASRS